MVKNEVAAYLIMESTTEPIRPENLQCFDKDNLFYLRFDTTLQTFNTKNRNGRIYIGDAMISGLNADHIMELERKKSWLGEAGHPMSDDIKRILTIDQKLASHKIVNHTVTNSYCKATVETLDNDGYGRQMTKSILQGLEPAFSLRALANVTKRADGTAVVQSRPHVVTYDWVILPSHKEAYRDESKPVQKIIKKINCDGNTVQESISCVQESAIIDLICMESMNVDLISNIYEVAKESMTLTQDLHNVILREGGNTFYVPIEEKIKADITEYLKNL